MSDLVTIRAAIKARLELIPNIGVVHDYERFANRKSEFKAIFESNNEMLGWFFFRERTAELDGDTGEVRRLHYWRFFGFNALNDAAGTAKTFQALTEAIAAAFRSDPTMGGVIDDNKDMEQVFGAVGIQIDSIENVMFADVLCHRAQLSLVTETRESK